MYLNEIEREKRLNIKQLTKKKEYLLFIREQIRRFEIHNYEKSTVYVAIFKSNLRKIFFKDEYEDAPSERRVLQKHLYKLERQVNNGEYDISEMTKNLKVKLLIAIDEMEQKIDDMLSHVDEIKTERESANKKKIKDGNSFCEEVLNKLPMYEYDEDSDELVAVVANVIVIDNSKS